MEKSHAFCNNDADSQLLQYPASRQNETRSLEKDVSTLVNTPKKVVIFEEILTNIEIFNPRFVDEIKDPYTKKTYEKICLNIQIYNDKNKNFVLIQLLKI